MEKSKKTPVLLVTGFLGSGKTTFLNWLIKKRPDIKISLILNEFGEVSLESQFIEKSPGIQVAELANGCMCCVAKSDIPRVIRLILEKSPQTQYIVIETSGLSDPDPIHDALKSPELAKKVTLQSIVCIVDAVNFEKTRNEHAIVMSQVGDADIIILSKVKEAGEKVTQRVKDFIESLGINTKVLLWDDSLGPDLFLHKAKSERKDEAEDKAHHHKHEKYDEYWFHSNKQINLNKFLETMKDLPKNIVRSKGYINCNGKKIMIQYVPKKLETFESEWENTLVGSAVLFLGKNIDTANLQKKLDLCEIG